MSCLLCKRVRKNLPLVLIKIQKNSLFTFRSCLIKHILILSLLSKICLPRRLLSSRFLAKISCSYFSALIRATRTDHLISLSNVRGRVKFHEILMLKFSSCVYHFLCLRPSVDCIPSKFFLTLKLITEILPFIHFYTSSGGEILSSN